MGTEGRAAEEGRPAPARRAGSGDQLPGPADTTGAPQHYDTLERRSIVDLAHSGPIARSRKDNIYHPWYCKVAASVALP